MDSFISIVVKKPTEMSTELQRISFRAKYATKYN